MRLTAYFRSRLEAQMAAHRLGSFFKVSDPEPVTPLDGRSWVIEVQVPSAYTLGSWVDPAVLARVIAAVNLYDGFVHDGSQP